MCSMGKSKLWIFYVPPQTYFTVTIWKIIYYIWPLTLWQRIRTDCLWILSSSTFDLSSCSSWPCFHQSNSHGMDVCWNCSISTSTSAQHPGMSHCHCCPIKTHLQALEQRGWASCCNLSSSDLLGIQRCLFSRWNSMGRSVVSLSVVTFLLCCSNHILLTSRLEHPQRHKRTKHHKSPPDPCSGHESSLGHR